MEYDPGISEGCLNEELSDINLMQSTGQKDRNGKEIWEGDILSRYRGDKEVGEVFWNANISSFSTPWDEVLFWPERYEIIGNIWENPELKVINEDSNNC